MEYRSGRTRDQHPGMDFFPDLAPRAKPYCGVKCSQGLHSPVGICYKGIMETYIIQTVKTYLYLDNNCNKPIQTPLNPQKTMTLRDTYR